MLNCGFRLISVVGIFIASASMAQTSLNISPSQNWFHEDAKSQKVNGVSSVEAYQLLQGKKSKTVIVAVIDAGIDINHEDLKDVIWINPKEIAGNGLDDDENGFIDDIHGWNFLGGKNGMNVGPENFEVTREYRRLYEKYEGVKESKKPDYLYWQEIEKGYLEGLKKAESQSSYYGQVVNSILRYEKLLTAYLDVDEITEELLLTIESPDEQITYGTKFMANVLNTVGDGNLSEFLGHWEEAYSHYNNQVEFGYNLDYQAREIIGDDPNNLAEVGYGNNDVIGIDTDNFHGTFVAGLIAAKRDNNIGIDGIADDVRIMALRAVPDGDEYDKDVANAIRYAVDNGAKIINMSFGKAYSPNKQYVDDAIRYAEKHGVLLVHAAGNAGDNIDDVNNYPTKKIGEEIAANWIEVGASSWGDDEQLAASFSNYSRKTVDLFAPGVQIYSTKPGNEYGESQGTSFSSPVTAGVAALLMSYYPHLSYIDVKDILMKSTRKFDGLMVIKPGTVDEKINFAKLSVSGGIVNAYEAVKLVESRLLSLSDQ